MEQAPKLIKPKMSSETPTASNKRRLQESSPLTCMLLESDESKKIRTDSEVPDHWSEVSDVPLDQPQQSTSTSNLTEPQQSTSTSSTDKACSNGTFHKFIVIESADDEKSFNKLSPFAIEKGIKGCIGEVASVKRQRSGALVVEVLRETQAKNLLKLDTFVQCPVKVSPHRTLNNTKGVIRSNELLETSEEELLQRLQGQGVTAVKRIHQTRDEVKRKTATIILTFSSSTLPRSIKAAYMNIAVEQYTPSPL